MKKRMSLVALFAILICVFAGCGSKATSQQKPAQETDQETADQETADQETADQETADQETADQETAAQGTAEQPDSNDVAISDVKHWKIENGQLLGQTGPEDFTILASLPTDSHIRDYATVVSSSEDLLLINQDAAFYKYDLKSNQATLINSGAYDSSYDSYAEAIYFIRPDGSEYVIKDWKTGEAVETNNFRVSYNICRNTYKVDGFDEFAEIQEAIKNGNYKAAFDKGYIVDENGDIYDFYNHYITNVHLPEAYAGNIYAAGDITALVKDGKASFYRYGEEISTIELPSGSFVVVDLFLKTNGNDASALLFNFDDRSLYKAETSSVKKIFGDVKDYFAPGDGHVYWIDGENRGNVCNWNFDLNYATVAEDITGVSHYRDFSGFVVDEDEDQAEEVNGLYILVY